VVGPQQLPVADARLHGEYDLGDDLGGLWPHHVGAQDLPGVLVDHQLQRPLGSQGSPPARSTQDRPWGSPRAGRWPWPARRSGPRRQAAAGCYRPRQALAADLSGSPERVAAGHGPRRHRPVGQPGWAGHVAGGVDAGRGGALLLVDGDAAVVPKPHAGVVQAELFHVGQAGVGADHHLDVDGPNRALREP
jgi:hypothetical protein